MCWFESNPCYKEIIIKIKQVPNELTEEEKKALDVLKRLKTAARDAVVALRFAKPTERRTKVMNELEEAINEARDSLF